MKSGLLVVDKERGFTSFDVVAKLRGMLKEKKIGHSGTLDPDATGLLLILLGKATKALPYLKNHDKTYRATLYLGRTTDTYDASGNVTGSCDKIVSDEQIIETILSFKGKQKQLPPMSSAKKINGKKLYELAREGKEVERKEADIEIYDLEVKNVAFPRVEICVSCSSGTYIRSLIHDIGQKLGTGAYMESLRRTMASGYDISDSHTLEEIQTACDNGLQEDLVIPLKELFSYPTFVCKKEADFLLNNGNRIPLELAEVKDVKPDDLLCLCRSDGIFAGIYRMTDRDLKLEKYFLEES